MPSKIEKKQHFVTFYSPGTFLPENTSRPVKKWDVDAAVALSGEIDERHGARPFGFRFSTRGRGPDDLDSKQTAESPMYYLGGTVRTMAEVEADADPAEKILLSNMRCNNIARVVTNTNSWKHTAELRDGDVVLPAPKWVKASAAKAVSA